MTSVDSQDPWKTTSDVPKDPYFSIEVTPPCQTEEYKGKRKNLLSSELEIRDRTIKVFRLRTIFGDKVVEPSLLLVLTENVVINFLF